ncbi:StsB family radical SAM/SPASM domain sactipeptide maturase [Phytomonospora endophytica]|uniref:Radical SAM protein with 4Fe4S-binding SPASM domain n=1 Tax=Phytomonospora endophytica TaxID=714109 RepID=A0A841FWH8_9ACTN|nr:StsB family radical SAM/SPASM domain sactipeptide maturase [Phytomonospora endophytica]MBB6037892.1 radical SAM protein with 4Fe4S-binding SPASM domain [Phytomonospora endophytica]GIG68792.1 hypothetical protein Pen01_50870 [Phytomonospora endophytica]
MLISGQLDALVVPDDIVVFRAANGDRFALNPTLAAWGRLTPRQDEILCALARRDLAFFHPDDFGLALEKDLAQLVVNFLAYLPGHEPQRSEHVVELRIVYYAITDGCNLRCPYCYASSEKALPGELSHEESLRLVEQAAELGAGTMVFTGGEPMMRRDLFDVVRHARSLGMRTNIITNGTLIRNAKTAETMSELFDMVTVSMDGATAEQHEKTRGRGTFAKTSTGLRLLNDAGVVPMINHVVTNDNVQYLEDFADFAGQFKLQRVRMMQHSDLGRGQGDDLSFGWGEYMKIHDFAWTHPKAKNMLPDHVTPEKPCNVRANCGMGSNEIYVNSLGAVYPCKLVTSPKDLAGNVKASSLREIFNGELFAEFQNSTIFGGTVHTDCERCYIKGACGGGCRAYHLAQSGDLRKNSRQLCRILRHQKISSIWHSLGASGDTLVGDSEAFQPRLARNGEVHPVYEDWRTELAATPPASPQTPSRRLLNIVEAR